MGYKVSVTAREEELLATDTYSLEFTTCYAAVAQQPTISGRLSAKLLKMFPLVCKSEAGSHLAFHLKSGPYLLKG